MNSKTPLTILHEKCSVERIVPRFILTEDGAGDSGGRFTCQVVAGDSEATGTGRSKKTAKQDAAANLLPKLDSTVSSSEEWGESKQRKSGEFVNEVGRLQNLLTERRLPLPAYYVSCQNGTRRARKFVARCSVYNIEEYGTAKSKQGAKHEAARKMAARIIQQFDNREDHLRPRLNDEYDVNARQEIIELYKQLTPFKDKDKVHAEDLDPNIVDPLPSVETTPFIRQLRRGSRNVSALTLKEKYERLLKDLGFEGKIAKTWSERGVLVIASVNTRPETNLMAYGDTQQEAYERIYTRVINFLLKMADLTMCKASIEEKFHL